MLVGDPDLFIMSNISLDNVWICTTHPDNEPLTVTQDLATGGCLGSNLDEPFPKHIVKNKVPDSSMLKGNVSMFRPFTSNAIRFSFPIEYSLERTSLYVHVQSTIDITPSTLRRRNLLQNEGDGTASSTRHFVGSVGITDSPLHETVDNEHGGSVLAEEEHSGIAGKVGNEQRMSMEMVLIIAVLATSTLCLCCGGVVALCIRYINSRRSDKQYL